MAPKRNRGRPAKAHPISPEKLRPTARSPPPLPQKRGRGRPPKSQRSSFSARPQKRAKADKKGPTPRKNPLFKAKRILDETDTEYLIEWDENDPNTGDPYDPSWHPKACANKNLINEWEGDKQGEEFVAQGIVDENRYCYKVSWANDPKTGEVYRDTWEPKAFVSKGLIVEWKRRRSVNRTTNGAESAARSTSGEELSSSDDESLNRVNQFSDSSENEGGGGAEDKKDQEDENDETDDALQQQIVHEMQSSPRAASKNNPKVRRRLK